VDPYATESDDDVPLTCIPKRRKQEVENKVVSATKPRPPPIRYMGIDGTSDMEIFCLETNTVAAIHDTHEPAAWYIGYIVNVDDQMNTVTIWWHAVDHNELGTSSLKDRKYIPCWFNKKTKKRKMSVVRPDDNWTEDVFLVDKSSILLHGFQLSHGHVLRSETLKRILVSLMKKETGDECVCELI
jgi:hypothetical protein